MLLAVCSSILKKSNPTREVALGLCRQVGKVGDAEFVYELDLGGRGLADRVKNLGFGYQDVEGADVLHSFIANSIKELKRRTKKQATAIYPGRDVWCWEVMSRRQGMPSLYDSKVSRSIATNPKAIKKVIEPWQIADWEKTVLFDTGHQGTVPRAIGEAAGVKNPNVIMLSAIDPEYQIFKTHAKSRKKALACEYLAKYRKRAVVRNDEAYQELADLEEFIKASLLTIWLWYHVSPARLPAWRDREVIKTKDGLKFGNNALKRYGSTNINQTLFTQIPVTTGPIWATTGATTATTPSIIDVGNWPNNTSVTTGTSQLDGWFGVGSTQYAQNFISPPAPVVPAVDPKTLQLIDPVSKTRLEPAMDAKAAGLDPVQYEIQRARLEMRGKLAAAGAVNANGRIYPTPGISGKDIVAYGTAKLNAATAKANNDTAKRLEPIKDQIPAIMAASNAPPGQLPDMRLGIEVDKSTGAVHKTITYKSPFISSQPGGVPVPGSVPTPTSRGTPVRQLTDGNGKAICI
jgi:hypothetical protein